MNQVKNKLAFKKNTAIIFLFLFVSLTITSCTIKEYYLVKPFDFDYNEKGEEVFSIIENNAFLTFPVSTVDTYIVFRIKNAQEYNTLYIKEISCQVNNSKIVLLKDRNYEINYEHITLGRMEKRNVRELLRNVGANNIELPIVYEYILDNGDLIHEEYIYFFEYEKRTVFFWEK